MEQNASDLIALVDGEGNELIFEILDVVPHLGRFFAVLLPVESASDEATILEVLGDGPEDESFAGIADPALLKTVFELFRQRAREYE